MSVARDTARQKRILVIDSDAAIQEMVASSLSPQCAVTSAHNEEEGLRLFQREDFDLVISDRTTPEMNGNELAAAVQSLAPETPIVLISGDGGLEVDTTRFSAFLRKPFTIVE